MALKPNAAAAAQAPAFEPLDDDQIATGEQTADSIRGSAQERLAEAAGKHAASKPAEASKSTGVAVPAGTQVAAAKPMINPLEPLKDAFHVEYDTLRNLVITNGNVMDRDTNKPLGDAIGLELLSYQDQYVVSPGVDGEEAKEVVRYSDDGVTTTQGEDVKGYLAKLKEAGYEDAKVSQRMVICGSVFEPGKLKDLKDSLVQISLPPTSMAAFKRYLIDQAFKIGKNFIPAEGANRLKIECTLTTKGSNTWTVASFSRYDDK